ncbi:hypothetical protein [Methylacidimicrobium sp. B4]|uniref:hypothetical protein n=1 Tax=Methylacidimicrobium sp. B4 TaxID=2796139 RepID=UPI001A8C6557|nr:hypothetical protein [Methylacidimicrobium sp. B4]QSR85043.1 hypothetical protein MacB4_01875 [Methylacidimicrobium sp. B4]
MHNLSTEDWQKIFGGEAQVIVARLKAANGITYYEFRNWDPDPLRRGIGGTATYVLAEDGQVLVPWRFQWFGDDAPPWVRLGLTFAEAVAMEKQVYEKLIQLWGFEEARKGSLHSYMQKGVRHTIDDYYPEVIEAQKELGLLPKDFVPPPLSPPRQRSLRIMLREEEPKPQFTPEQNRAITEKLSELVRANAQGDKAAAEKASRELSEIMRPKPSEPKASSEREKP